MLLATLFCLFVCLLADSPLNLFLLLLLFLWRFSFYPVFKSRVLPMLFSGFLKFHTRTHKHKHSHSDMGCVLL